MPFLIQNNHFCLVVSDFKESTFLFLDPFGAEIQSTTSKNIFDKFKNFLDAYIKFYSMPNTQNSAKHFTQIHKHHTTQKDDYNCGVYIIYFFQQICAQSSINEHFDPDAFRKDLLSMILENSDNVSNKCIYCGNMVNDKEIIRCKTCKRFAHIQNGCSTKDEFLYGICDLCQQF